MGWGLRNSRSRKHHPPEEPAYPQDVSKPCGVSVARVGAHALWCEIQWRVGAWWVRSWMGTDGTPS
ncbi:MAG: hypothetical protein AAGF92_23265, partial [Myxococcota bacterium]